MFEDEDIEILEDDLLDKPNASPSSLNNDKLRSENLNKNSNIVKNEFENNNKDIGKAAQNNLNKGENRAASVSNVDNGNQFKKAGNVSRMSKGLSSDDLDTQKEAGKALTKETIKPIARSAVKSATGGLVPGKIVDSVVDKAVDKVADSEQGEKVIQEATKKVKKVRQKIVLPIIGSIASSLIPFILIIVVVTAPVLAVNDFGSWIGGAVVDIVDFLTFNGICTAETCKDRYETRFYTVVEQYSEQYTNGCDNEMDLDLLTATIFYEQMMTSGDEGSNGSDERYDYGRAHKEFMKLASVLYPNYFVDRSSDTELLDSILDSLNVFDSVGDVFKEFEILISSEEKKCPADYEGYMEYLDNTYIDSRYTKLKKGNYSNYTNEEIVAEVMSFGSGAIGSDDDTDSNWSNSGFISSGIAGIIPTEILQNSINPLGQQQTGLTSCFGYYSPSNCTAHSGVDLVGNVANPTLYSIADGVVHSVVRNAVHCVPDWKGGKACSVCANSAGNYIIIEHTVEEDGQIYKFYSKYLHLASIKSGITRGTKVTKGQEIAVMGNTGCSTGTHLHFSIHDSQMKNYNPEELLQYLGISYPASRCEEARRVCR